MSRITATDLMAVLGVVLLTIGAGLAYLPLGFIVPGSLILAYAVLPDQRTETP